MSIASEITRLQSAKSDIKSAIEAKGVIVPSSASISTYDDYVSQISGGGGSSADTAILIDLIERDIISIDIPNGVTSIGNYTFYGCSGLTSVTIPSGVTSIGNYAFYDCSGLTSVTIPNGVTSIGSSAFRSCDNLTSITIPDSVTSIGEWCFQYCSLTSVTIPSGVTSIENYTFTSCSSLTSVTIGNSVTSIGTNAFRDCRSLTSVTIPNSVTSIGGGAFNNCSGLTSVIIGSGATSIGNNAFSGATGALTVNCNIPNSAFTKSKFSSVTIGDNVTSIGHYAFSGCSSLTSVTVNAATPPTLGTNVFISTNDCPIYVPSASVNTYKAATNWSDYASRIQAIPSESCIDDSDGTWVAVDDNFNTEQAVYKLDFGGLYDAVLHGASYPSASIDLYDENQNNIGMVDAFYDETNELSNVKVYSGSVSTEFIVIYNEDVGEVDICSLFGKPLYLEYGGETPVYEYCADSQCIQYCCNEWDEETGECIDYDYGCCEEEECLEYDYIYLSSAFVENNNS